MRKLTCVLAAAAAVLALAGCGPELIPAEAMRTTASSHQASTTAAASARHESARTGAQTAAAHARPAATRPPVLGVDLYAPTAYPVATVTTDGAADMAYLHGTLRAQSVGLVWNLGSPSDRSDTVRAVPQSLSPAAVGELTRLAERAGLSVEYRPLIRVGPVSDWDRPTKSWQGWIQPARPRAWFASLYRAELPYLRVAQRLHVREFVLATELYKIGASPAWAGFLKKVRAVYHGTVSYAAVMKQYFLARPQLAPVPDMGLDAYPSLPLPDSASQRQVTAGWERYLGTARLTLLRRTAMDEVSIAGTSGSYRLPADWNRPGHPDPEIQARWFTAACATAAHFHMRAIYFYELRLSADPAQRLAYPAFFAGKPGAKAIAGCRAVLRG